MKYKTKGIVFNYIKFQESTIITNIYTELFGLKSYIINNVRSSKPKFPIGFFQPMTQLELIVYNKLHAGINRVVEIRGINVYKSIPYDIYKTTITLFLTEILHKILKEEEPNKALYNFLEDSLNYFEQSDTSYLNFHLQFLLKLTKFLGIEPQNTNQLIQQIEYTQFVHTKNETDYVELFLSNPLQVPVKMSNKKRRELIEIILLFYKSNFNQLSTIKSYDVLKEVFDQ